jgi:hypothetical protein
LFTKRLKNKETGPIWRIDCSGLLEARRSRGLRETVGNGHLVQDRFQERRRAQKSEQGAQATGAQERQRMPDQVQGPSLLQRRRDLHHRGCQDRR